MEKIVNPLRLNRPPKQPYIGAERIRGGEKERGDPTGYTSTTRAHWPRIEPEIRKNEVL